MKGTIEIPKIDGAWYTRRAAEMSPQDLDRLLRPKIRQSVFPPPGPLFVPVRAAGPLIIDNGGDVIATCFTEVMAALVADLINKDAGL